MIGTLDIEHAAKKAAGNWQRFESFMWFRDLEDSENWSIVYTSNRDSGLLEQSNAAVIKKTMEPFTEGDDPDVVMERHNHWAVGHIDGFSIRVFDQHGEITEAFQAYYELLERMDNYPILDEDDYSNREAEATFENIVDAAWRLKHEYELPEDWVDSVHSWLSDNDSGQIENRDDRGGYPKEEALRAAFEALGFREKE
jgi:hypothetical protein